MLGCIKQENILGREVFIYLPPSYKNTNTNSFPVLYSHDGAELYKYSEELISSFEESFKDNSLKEFIWVGIYSSSRIHEYTPWKAPSLVPKFDDFEGRGKEYIEFISNDLKSVIDTNYKTLPDPKNTYLMGYSLGGLISIYSLSITDKFGKIASICGSFWYNNFVNWISENNILNNSVNMYIHYGKKEGLNKKTAQKDAVSCTEKVIEILKSNSNNNKILKVSFDDGGHHQYIVQRYKNAIAYLASN